MPEPPVAAPDHTETLERILDYYEADAKALDGIAVMLGLRQAQLGREALAALLVERRQDKERIERLETTLEWALDCLELLGAGRGGAGASGGTTMSADTPRDVPCWREGHRGRMTDPAAARPENDRPFATIIAPFDECENCGSKTSENVTWNRTGGWTCAACGDSDYPEAAE